MSDFKEYRCENCFKFVDYEDYIQTLDEMGNENFLCPDCLKDYEQLLFNRIETLFNAMKRERESEDYKKASDISGSLHPLIDIYEEVLFSMTQIRRPKQWTSKKN